MRLGLVIIAALLNWNQAVAGSVAAVEIHRAVAAFVRTELADRLAAGERIEVDTRWQRDVPLATPGEVEIKVHSLSERPLRGPSAVGVAIRVDGRLQREINVTAEVRIFSPVLVVNRPVRRGEELSAALVDRVEKETTALAEEPYTDVAQLQGLRVRRAVGAGQILTAAHAERIPVVRQGAEVTLVIQTRNLEISTPGIALQDGGAGERIRVRNPESGKMVYGDVVDARTVRVGM
jgi:flagellar basal body P-ring formation protein FlgA